MDVNVIIENLLERIKLLTKENAFLVAQLQHEQEAKETKGDKNNDK